MRSGMKSCKLAWIDQPRQLCMWTGLAGLLYDFYDQIMLPKGETLRRLNAKFYCEPEVAIFLPI